MNWPQLITGISIPILASTINTDYVEMNWFLSIKDFLNAVNATIHIPNLWVPAVTRVNDIVLMDAVAKLDISMSKKRSFNIWRMFYQVNTLSDMTNSQGTHILPSFLNKYGVDTYTSTSVLQWPNQQAPSTKYFTNWLHILRAATGIDKNGKLN